MAEDLNFRIEFVPCLGCGFGTRIDNTSWTGLVGMLMKGSIDMTVVDMAVTQNRAEVSLFFR